MDELPETPRASFALAEAGLPDFERAATATPDRFQGIEYRLLSVAEAQCRAAAHDSIANLLDAERDADAAAESCSPHGSADHGPLQRRLLYLRSLDERNRAAATGLTLFFRLAEAEAGSDALDRSLLIVEGAQRDVEQIQAQGIKFPADPSLLPRRRLELLDERERTRLAILGLNGQLCSLLGLEAAPSVRLWPDAELTVPDAPPDVAAALSYGLARRPDLVLLRCLRNHLNEDTLATARRVLNVTNGALGATTPASRVMHACLHKACEAEETQVRRAQLDELIQARERVAAQEIRQAVYEVETRLRQIGLAHETRQIWRQRLADIQALRSAAAATPGEVSAVELELLGAETAAVRSILALRLAEVELKRSQGVLAEECGFAVDAPCR